MQQPITVSNQPTKRSKKWLWIALSTIVITIAGIVAMLVFSDVRANLRLQEIESFHELLEKHNEDILYLTALTDSIYNEGLSLADFMLEGNNYDSIKIDLERALTGLEEIYARLQAGPELYGTNNDIDLKENYQGLKTVLSQDIDKYKNVANLTLDLLKAFLDLNNISSAELRKNYEMESIFKAIDDYAGAVTEAYARIENLNCSEQPTGDQCADAFASLYNSKELLGGPEIIMDAYRAVIGDFPPSDQESVEYYYNNLYIGTESHEEE